MELAKKLENTRVPLTLQKAVLVVNLENMRALDESSEGIKRQRSAPTGVVHIACFRSTARSTTTGTTSTTITTSTTNSTTNRTMVNNLEEKNTTHNKIGKIWHENKIQQIDNRYHDDIEFVRLRQICVNLNSV